MAGTASDVSRRGGPLTISSATSQNAFFPSFDLMVSRNGRMVNAGAVGFDTGASDCLACNTKAGQLDDIIGYRGPCDKKFVTADGHEFKALEKIVLEFCINGTWCKTTFVVVPDNDTFEFLLGAKILIQLPKLILEVLVDEKGMQAIIETLGPMEGGYQSMLLVLAQGFGVPRLIEALKQLNTTDVVGIGNSLMGGKGQDLA